MSNIDKRALREAAERATESDWIVDAHEGWHAVIPVADAVNGNYIIAEFQGPESKRNRDFVAAANPVTVLALLDELESDKEQIKTLESRNRRLEGIIDAAEKRIAEPSGQKRLIGWRASDYTDETSDPELAKNWATAIGVLPNFEGDVNTKLSAAGIGEGE